MIAVILTVKDVSNPALKAESYARLDTSMFLTVRIIPSLWLL